MTFHFLITGLSLLAVLLFLGAAGSHARARRLAGSPRKDFRCWRDEWEWEP